MRAELSLGLVPRPRGDRDSSALAGLQPRGVWRVSSGNMGAVGVREGGQKGSVEWQSVFYFFFSGGVGR